MHLEALSNGMGAPSMLAFHYACEGKIPARISITADTGSEQHRLLINGPQERISAAEFYQTYVEPKGKEYGVECFFVRSKFKDGEPRPALWEQVKQSILSGEYPTRIHIPLFGSEGGRLKQSCTESWKVKAIKQCARSLGATSMRTAQGLHSAEFTNRAETRIPLGLIGGFQTYGSVDRVVVTKEPPTGGLFHFDNAGNPTLVTSAYETIEVRPIKWLSHYYPLGEGPLKMNRAEIRAECDRLGLPYLKTSECDICPHKDYWRWLDTPPEVIDEIAYYESLMKGEYFFTPLRVPLKEALRIMASKYEGKMFSDVADFGCANSYCGV